VGGGSAEGVCGGVIVERPDVVEGPEALGVGGGAREGAGEGGLAGGDDVHGDREVVLSQPVQGPVECGDLGLGRGVQLVDREEHRGPLGTGPLAERVEQVVEVGAEVGAGVLGGRFDIHPERQGARRVHGDAQRGEHRQDAAQCRPGPGPPGRLPQRDVQRARQ